MKELTAQNSSSGKKLPFLLLHGAWYDSSCWDKSIKMLEDQNYKVYKLDLPYYQEQLDEKIITRQIYIEEKVLPRLNKIEANTGQRPILVGHSLSGTIIAETAELYPDKLSGIVFLAGFMLINGMSIMDIRKHRKRKKINVGAVVSRGRLNGKLKVVTLDKEYMAERFCQDCSLSEQSEIKIHWNVPEPLVKEKVKIGSNYNQVPRFYIKTLLDQAIHVAEQNVMTRFSTCTDVFELKSGHSPFINKTNELVAILRKIESRLNKNPGFDLLKFIKKLRRPGRQQIITNCTIEQFLQSIDYSSYTSPNEDLHKSD